MRLILNTNVVLSALLWRGTPYRLLSAIAQQPRIQLFSSTALLEELADVLSRSAISKQLSLIGRNAHEVLADYIEAIEWVEPISVPRVVPNDADDDHVIAAAVAACASLIVTGDRKHLLPIGNYRGIDIVDAAEAIKRIAQNPRE